MFPPRSSTFPVILPSHQRFKDKRFGFINREDWDNPSAVTPRIPITQPSSINSPLSNRSSDSSYHSSYNGVGRPDSDTLPGAGSDDGSISSFTNALRQDSYVPFTPRKRVSTPEGVYVSISNAAAAIFSIPKSTPTEFALRKAPVADHIPPPPYRWPLSDSPPRSPEGPTEAPTFFSPFNALREILERKVETSPQPQAVLNSHQSWFSDSTCSDDAIEPHSPFDMFDFQRTYTEQTLKMMTEERWRPGEVLRHSISIVSPRARVMPMDGRIVIHKAKRSLLN